jgi:hypothetical protein
MCAYYAVQRQISDINEQISFIYQTLSKLSELTLKINELPTISITDFEEAPEA